MIRRFGQRTSISTVNPASSPLRSHERAGQRKTFFATCWLIVEPPRSRSLSAIAARIPSMSNPQCRQKFASSAAAADSGRFADIAASGTQSRSMPPSRSARRSSRSPAAGSPSGTG